MVLPAARSMRRSVAAGSSRSSWTRDALRTSACCSTTFPNTSSGSPVRRSPAASSSGSTRPTGVISSRSWWPSPIASSSSHQATSGHCSTDWNWGWARTGSSRLMRPEYASMLPSEAGYLGPEVRARGSVPPDLHVRVHGHAQGGPLHARAICHDGRPRRPGHPVGGRRCCVCPASVLPLELAVHWLVLVADRGRADRHPDPLLGVRHTGRHPAHRATVLTYTGKVLNYILAVPEQPDDGDTTLRLAIGNEASMRDISRVRSSLRLRRPGQLRVDRGDHHHPS